MGLRGCWILLLGMLLSGSAWAQGRVGVPLANVHAAPSTASERVTQVLLWDRVQLLKERGEWVRVLVTDQYRTPEGYPGWMHREDLAVESGPRGLPTATVQKARTALLVEPRAGAERVAWAYLGTRLPVQARREGWTRVALPTPPGAAWVSSRDLAAEGTLPLEGPSLLEAAFQLEGTPYLWGGMSSQGIDCSGFTYIVYRLHGHLIPRDADQQFERGRPVEREELRPGDLVFFGGGPQEITHVGFYLDGESFLDASGRQGVGISCLGDPRWAGAYVGARRILPGQEP